MSSQDMKLSVSFKVFLLVIAAVFAAVAIIMIMSSSLAATISGSSPALAVSLVDGPNTGVVAPGEQRWFRLTPYNQGQTGNLEESLTLIFTPDDGQRVKRVGLQIFDEAQLPFFYLGDSSKMVNLGAGEIVSRDNNPVTGELFWTGWLSGGKNYYLQLANSSDAPIDYWLFNDDVVNYPLGQSAPVSMVETSALSPTPPNTPMTAAPAAIEMGADLSNPLPLQPGVTHNVLKPNTTQWYIFTHIDPADPSQFQNLNFSLFFTPGDGNRQHRVNFKLFPADAVDKWRRGETDQLINFGAGMLVSRDGNGQTGERFWSGTVIRGQTYLLAVENGAEVDITYWLFDSNVEHPELNP